MLDFLRGLAAWRTRSEHSRKTNSRRNSSKNLRHSVKLSLEQLEDRLNPSVANISPAEQLMIELINRARANPLGEASRYGVDLNQGLTPGTISASAVSPLAPHQALVNSAGFHSDDMYARNFFSHV